MKRKMWIWIGVGILVIILGAVLMSRANQAAEAKEDEADLLEEKEDLVNIPENSRKECRKVCRTQCKAKHNAIFGGRGRCKRNCKADCSDRGIEYVKANY